MTKKVSSEMIMKNVGLKLIESKGKVEDELSDNLITRLITIKSLKVKLELNGRGKSCIYI